MGDWKASYRYHTANVIRVGAVAFSRLRSGGCHIEDPIFGIRTSYCGILGTYYLNFSRRGFVVTGAPYWYY